VLHIVLGIITVVFCFYLVFKLTTKLNLNLSFGFIGAAYSVRILFGIALTLIYTYYYPNRTLADTFRYFDDSVFLHLLLHENLSDYFHVMIGWKAEERTAIPLLEGMTNWYPALRSPLYNDNRTVIRINSILRWFSFGSYYVHMVLFSFAGFVGQMYFFKAFQKYFKGKETWLGAAVFLIPSLIFWTSGILKEGLLFLALGYLLYIVEKVSREGINVKSSVIILLLFFFLFHMKFYVGLMLLPIFSMYWMFIKWQYIARWKLILANYLSYFLAALVWHMIRFKWSLFTVFKWKKKDFEGLGESMDARSMIKTYDLEDNPLSFLLNIPQGLFNSLFRPFVWEAYSPLIVIPALENIFLLVFMAFCFSFRSKVRASDIGLCFLMYALTLLIVVGMVTPIMGSLVRYKIPALPFLMMFFIGIVDVEKVKGLFRKA